MTMNLLQITLFVIVITFTVSKAVQQEHETLQAKIQKQNQNEENAKSNDQPKNENTNHQQKKQNSHNQDRHQYIYVSDAKNIIDCESTANTCTKINHFKVKKDATFSCLVNELPIHIHVNQQDPESVAYDAYLTIERLPESSKVKSSKTSSEICHKIKRFSVNDEKMLLLIGKTLTEISRDDEEFYISAHVFKKWSNFPRYFLYCFGYYDPVVEKILYMDGFMDVLIYLSLPCWLIILLFNFVRNSWNKLNNSKKEKDEIKKEKDEIKSLLKKFEAKMKTKKNAKDDKKDDEDESEGDEEDDDDSTKKPKRTPNKRKSKK